VPKSAYRFTVIRTARNNQRLRRHRRREASTDKNSSPTRRNDSISRDLLSSNFFGVILGFGERSAKSGKGVDAIGGILDRLNRPVCVFEQPGAHLARGNPRMVELR